MATRVVEPRKLGIVEYVGLLESWSRESWELDQL